MTVKGKLTAALVLIGSIAAATAYGVWGRSDGPPPAASLRMPPAEQIPPAELVDAGDLLDRVADALSLGRSETAQHLARIGFAEQVEEVRTVDGYRLSSFSSRTLLETLYRRAELKSAGEGERFLAVLYQDAAQDSLALASDPDFEYLRQYSKDKLDLRSNPIRFAPLSELAAAGTRVVLSPASQRAISAIADMYSAPHLGQIRLLALNAFRKPGFGNAVFERAIAEASSTREAIELMVQRGTPPPKAERALLEILTGSGDKVVQVPSELLEAMAELSRELPEELERYAELEDGLQSRRRQAAEARKIGAHGKIAIPTDQHILIAMARDDQGPPPAAQALDTGGSPFGGAPGGGEAAAQKYAQNYSKYTSRTFVPRDSSPNASTYAERTPRDYPTAIRSARAARGIAVGGAVTAAVGDAPRQAFWLPNEGDGRFGRLFVRFDGAGDVPALAASRVMFADSFYAAVGVIWSRNDVEATFRDGEILVLMSMDPEAELPERENLQRRYRDWERRYQDWQRRYQNREGRASIAERAVLLRSKRHGLDPERRALQSESDALLKDEALRLRGIVVHPALFGRELAWSTARVDFWFNDIELLSQESAAMNGGKPLLADLRAIDVGEAGARTWQFYERDSRIELQDLAGAIRHLKVVSHGGPGTDSERSHFSVSMFDGRENRLEDLEIGLQPVLDWVSLNHHDFMRLNDFSESFSLLRWLVSTDVATTIIDLDGQSSAIATPDRVIIGDGPGVSSR